MRSKFPAINSMRTIVAVVSADVSTEVMTIPTTAYAK